MKRSSIPQYEFGFTGETFNLAQERTAQPVAVAVAPVIMAEMTAEEREAARQKAFAGIRAGIDAPVKETTQAGLAAGSCWHHWERDERDETTRAMRKAIATA